MVQYRICHVIELLGKRCELDSIYTRFNIRFEQGRLIRIAPDTNRYL